MRILVLSDIHANLYALEAVLQDAGEYEAVWCLGDLVGYGPDPNECLDLIQTLPELSCVLGNHDSAITGAVDTEVFNPDARRAIEWTREIIAPANRAFLEQLPSQILHERVTLVHGSPRDPVHEYLLDRYTATLNFAYFSTPFCFVGHTHVPTIFHLNQGYSDIYFPEINVHVNLEARLIINPGSVGQPRDRDPRAAYAIFNSEDETWHFRRTAYDVEEVQERMRGHGLPERHALRLAEGW